jgi:formate--tetrahydrofolate ligase
VEKVKAGLPNLMAHVENIKKYTKNIIVCLNKYVTDTEEEIKVVEEYCTDANILFSLEDSFVTGGKGSIDLAEKVISLCDRETDFKLLYKDDLSIKNKIETICKEIYHAGNINYTDLAQKQLEELESYSNLPMCIAKTQYSLSDDPNKLGSPKDFTVTVRELRLYRGAGFITVLLGEILTMPGLSRRPNLENIYISEKGEITGLF